MTDLMPSFTDGEFNFYADTQRYVKAAEIILKAKYFSKEDMKGKLNNQFKDILEELFNLPFISNRDESTNAFAIIEPPHVITHFQKKISNKKKLNKIHNGWIGYVIKVHDYAKYQGDERRKEMIFPYNTTYSNKDDCYRKFKILFSKDPLLSIYSQSSYIHGCIEN